MHAGGTETHHEAGTTPGLELVVTHRAIGRHPIHREAVGVSTAADPVLDASLANIDRGKQRGKRVAHEGVSSAWATSCGAPDSARKTQPWLLVCSVFRVTRLAQPPQSVCGVRHFDR